MQILFWKFSSSKQTVNRHMSVYLSEENLGGTLMCIWCWSEVVFFWCGMLKQHIRTKVHIRNRQYNANFIRNGFEPAISNFEFQRSIYLTTVVKGFTYFWRKVRVNRKIFIEKKTFIDRRCRHHSHLKVNFKTRLTTWFGCENRTKIYLRNKGCIDCLLSLGINHFKSYKWLSGIYCIGECVRCVKQIETTRLAFKKTASTRYTLQMYAERCRV